jgi:hypothetical protein
LWAWSPPPQLPAYAGERAKNVDTKTAGIMFFIGITPNYFITTCTEKAVFQIILSYLLFKIISFCGIPSV